MILVEYSILKVVDKFGVVYTILVQIICFNYTFVTLKRKSLVFFFTEGKMYSDNKAT